MARRKKKIHRHASAELTSSDSRGFRMPVGLLAAILITVITAGIPFGLGKHIELNSPGPFDSGAFVYSAKHLLTGAQLGVDERSSARPETLLCNVIGVKLFGFNDRGPKIVQMILQLAAGVFMFYTLRKIFGSVAAVIGTTIAAVYLSAPLIAKYGNVKEQFMIPFMIAAACCFCLYEFSQKRHWLIASGFMALQPYFFKPTGMSIVFAIGLYILLKNICGRQWKNLLREILLFLAGYAAGLLIPATLFIWQKQPLVIFKTFPAVAIETGIILLLIIMGLSYGISSLRQHGIGLRKIKISKAIWLTGMVLIIAAFAFSIFIIQHKNGYVEGDISSYINSIPLVSLAKVPFKLIGNQYNNVMQAAGLDGGYVSGSRNAIDFSKLASQIMRYYKAVSVPILAALIAIVAAVLMWVPRLFKKSLPADLQVKIIWLLAIWWILDMAFVWISPRSYEQYYLPLCASGAMLSGFAFWFWQERVKTARVKAPWLIGGVIAVIVLGSFSMPIFIGQRYSPDTGSEYRQRSRGFAQSLKRVKMQGTQPWQAAGDYIRSHSTESDGLYVWGWVPGIYVQAQRLSPVSKAFESDMHIKTPRQLSIEIRHIVKELEANLPKFIVDSRKIHFPNDRPPLELWPHRFNKDKPRGGEPIPNNPNFIAQYDVLYKKLLAEKFDPRQKEYNPQLATMGWAIYRPWDKAMPDEAERYDAMKPLREFVMTRYRIVGHFGDHVLFERIDSP